MTVVADREPEAPPKDRRVWLILGVLLALGLTALAITRASEFCPPELRNVVDDDYQPTSDVVCDSPIVGTWHLAELNVSGSPSALPTLWDGTVTFLPDGTLNGTLCNSFSTHFQVSKTTLRTSEVARTLVGCPARQERIEEIVVSAFRYAEATFTVLTAEQAFVLVTPEEPAFTDSGWRTSSERYVLTITSGETSMVFQALDQ